MQLPLSPGMLLTRAQVAAWLQVKRRTLQRWEKEGRFPAAIDLNGQKRWRSETLTEWVLQCAFSATRLAFSATSAPEGEKTPSTRKRDG